MISQVRTTASNWRRTLLVIHRGFMRRLGYIVLLSSLTVTVVMFAVFVGEGIDAYYRSRLVDMVYGTAYRPYVSRVLVPGLARMLVRA